MRASKAEKPNRQATANNQRGRVFSREAVKKIRKGLPKECAEAFDTLVQRKCSSHNLAAYLIRLRLISDHNVNLERDPTRIDRDTLRSLADRTLHVADDWDKLFHTGFGQEVITLAVKRSFQASQAEFKNIPGQLRCISRAAKDIHGGTLQRRRPEYDDVLAEFCMYVELATRKPHLRQVSLLVGFAIENPEYTYGNLGVWKNDHKADVERARLRLTKN